VGGILFLLALPALFGIDLGYYFHLARGQWHLLWNQVPIGRVLSDADLDTRTRERLELVLDIRRFAIDELGMEASDTYTRFCDIGPGPVVWALTLSRDDRLEPFRWSYPIVGSAPYRGFFDRDRGETARARYGADGYDTYLRPVGAYSTLGWFPDPMLSSMLAYSVVDLADTVVHELMHETVWVQDHVDFNETMASFVGREGARLWLEGRAAGADSLRVARDARADRTKLRELMHDTALQLDSLYATQTERPLKLSRKDSIIAELRGRLGAQSWKTDTFRDFDRWTINNATLAIHRTYDRSSDLFERVHDRLGGNLKRTIEFLRDVDASEPYRHLERWLEASG
tara:strand:+ start:1793 stop:2821 length:1029 start_codon:yes stop_codon:yes gene_type:complete